MRDRRVLRPVNLLVCRENIEKDMEVERRRAENPDVMEEDVDQVPCITRAHFEEVRISPLPCLKHLYIRVSSMICRK